MSSTERRYFDEMYESDIRICLGSDDSLSSSKKRDGNRTDCS